MLKGDLSLNSDIIEKGYSEKITNLKEQAGNCQNKIIKNENIRDIRSGSVSNRSGRNKSESTKLTETLEVAQKLVQIENALKSPPSDLIGRSELFVQVTNLMKTFDGSELEELKLLRAYSTKLLQITPISEINKKWIENVTVNENEINCPIQIQPIIKAANIIQKIIFFHDKIYKGLIEFIKSNYSLSYESGCLKKGRIQRSHASSSSLKATIEFIKHLDNIGLAPQSSTSVKLLDSIIVSFLKKSIPSTESDSAEIKKSISLTLQLNNILDCDFKVNITLNIIL
jgi:hypothetical protein